MYRRGHEQGTRRQSPTASSWYAAIEAATLAQLDVTWPETPQLDSKDKTPMALPLITYRGVSMTPDWPAKIAQAQTIRTVTLDNVTYPRIPYGQEGWEDSEVWELARVCRDCGALLGELHVTHCAVECCPACPEEQRLSCQTGHDGTN